MKLGTLLLRDAVISLGQLEAALRTQVLYGGRLGTNLVELDLVNLDTLGDYLAAVLDVPVATAEKLEAADRDLLLELGAGIADRFSAVPLGREPGDPDTLAVAMVDPTDSEAVAELSRQCGYSIRSYVAAELRIYYYLEKYYRISRKARFVRTGTRQASPADERRHTHPPRGIEMPPAITFAPRNKRTVDGDAPAGGPTPHPQVSYAESCTALDAANHRDDIGDALIAYARGRFEVAVVFLLRDSNALGWRFASADGQSSFDLVEQLGLPLGGTSVLQAAHDSGKPYRGPSPSAGRPVELRLWNAVGTTEEPAEMLVVPILVRNRVVNLMYVHPFAGQRIPDHQVDELYELARRCTDAYVRLIQIAKSTVAAQAQQGEG